jgi:hypothetical protein
MTEREALKLALEALEWCHGGEPCGTAEAITALREALAEQPAQQEPVALKWQQAPVKTQWGDEMVVASVAIDKDHTVCLYCERDQTSKVDAMFAQRTWVGLTNEERNKLWREVVGWGDPSHDDEDLMKAIEAKLKEKNT